MTEVSIAPPRTLNVLSWNMLIDNTRTHQKIIRSQRERIPAFINTLQSFDGDLDVVGLQEVAFEEGVNCGESLVRSLGFNASFFYQHNLPIPGDTRVYQNKKRGRPNEYIGLFGERVKSAESIDIGDNRIAVKTSIGSIAIVTFHFRQGAENRLIRVEHAKRIIESVSVNEAAVLMGDTNENWTSDARQTIHDAGFESAFLAVGKARPATFPTPEYHSITYGVDASGKLKPAVSIDDIYVRGLTVIDAGLMEDEAVGKSDSLLEGHSNYSLPERASDHYGLWARLVL